MRLFTELTGFPGRSEITHRKPQQMCWFVFNPSLHVMGRSLKKEAFSSKQQEILIGGTTNYNIDK